MKKRIDRFKLTALLLCALLTLLVLWAYGTARISGGNVIISELRSDRDSALYDISGSYHGFVELYNTGSEPISLDGWYLTDTRNDLQKYRISDCVIPPHGYMVFWSNDEEDFEGIPLEGFFLGMSLQEKETVILSDPRRTAMDKIMIPALESNHSYAREAAAGAWGMRTATPGSANDGPVIPHSVQIDPPVFSQPSGFYEQELELMLSAPKGCTIHYTLDGSTPTADSPVYTQPLLLKDPSDEPNVYSAYTNIAVSREKISRTDIDVPIVESIVPDETVPKINIIRAVAVDARGNVSPETAASYLVDYEGRYGFEDMAVMSIITDPGNLFGDELGIYVYGDVWEREKAATGQTDEDVFLESPANYQISGKGWKRPAYIQMFNSGHEHHYSQMVSLSLHGNASVTHNQKSFNLRALPSVDGNEEVLPGIFPGKRASLMLRAGGLRDVHLTKIRDVLNHRLVRDRELTILEAIPCQVFLNGEYWGLYNLQERIDETLIPAKYPVNPENVIVVKNTTVVAGKQEEYGLYEQVVRFAGENDLSLSENYERISDMIDIQSYIDYYVFQIYIANFDSVANNYALWRARNPVDDHYGDGRWRWILYDTDDSTGMLLQLTTEEVDSFVDGHAYMDPMDDVLFSSLMCNEDFRLRFADTYIEMVENNFDYWTVDELITELADLYCEPCVVSHHRFTDPDYDESTYDEQVQVIRDFFYFRNDYLYPYMVEHLELEEYGY